MEDHKADQKALEHTLEVGDEPLFLRLGLHKVGITPPVGAGLVVPVGDVLVLEVVDVLRGDAQHRLPRIVVALLLQGGGLGHVPVPELGNRTHDLDLSSSLVDFKADELLSVISHELPPRGALALTDHQLVASHVPLALLNVRRPRREVLVVTADRNIRNQSSPHAIRAQRHGDGLLRLLEPQSFTVPNHEEHLAVLGARTPLELHRQQFLV
mmetsp:Transcript_35730/g.87894  ORF Transcript_35730/g.87894 Transcript_35730/m.87894 type:complete len:212 (-) Transcript_35730:390-1025(-)